MASISGQQFADAAATYIGDPYVYGAAGPTQFDCSGLVQFALERLGISNVPRTSEGQWSWVSSIKSSDLQAGDLVFSQWPGDNTSPGHVAIYVGDGQMVEAPKPGEAVHKIALNSFYQKYVTGYGRVPGLSYDSGTASSSSTSTSGTSSTSTGSSDTASAIKQAAAPIAATFGDFSSALTTAMHGVLWIVNPSNWLRVISGIIGGALLITGAVLVAQSA